MTEQEVRELLGERFERLSPVAHDELRHPDYALYRCRVISYWCDTSADLLT